MNAPAVASLQPGLQLGNLEYRIDDADLDAYRALVGDDGHYPNLRHDDCRALLTPHCGPTTLTAVWRRFEFLRPPHPGRRLQVSGWLRAVSSRGGFPYFRVAAFTVDEIGTEILRSEAAFRQGAAPMPAAANGVNPPPERPAQSGLDLPGDAESLRSITLPNAASGLQDWTIAIAGWLESALGRRFGADFRWGGRLTLAYPGAAAPSDIIAGTALILAADASPGGAIRYRIALTAANSASLAVAVGDAELTIPSPRLF